MSKVEVLLRYISKDLLIGQNDLTLEADENILTSGLIDSLGIMRMVAFVEDEFGIAIPPEDVTIEQFRTVQHLANYLDQKSLVTA